jgi:16S rRNA processing protein RimM
VAVGRIGKPHGVRGWVTVTPATDEPERRFAAGAIVLVGDAPRTVVESRISPKVALLLSGCTDREHAEALRGQWLYIEVDDEDVDDPDAFYDHQLEGLRVRVEGAEVGTVEEVLHLPGQDLLAVAVDGRQVLVPFVVQIVPVVDLAGGFVEVVALEGLFDAD